MVAELAHPMTVMDGAVVHGVDADADVQGGGIGGDGAAQGGQDQGGGEKDFHNDGLKLRLRK